MVISVLNFDIQYQYCLLNSLGIGWLGFKTLLDDWIIFLSWMPSFQCNVVTGNRLTIMFAIYLCFMATLWRNWFSKIHHQQPEVCYDWPNMVPLVRIVPCLVLWCNRTVRPADFSTDVSASGLDLLWDHSAILMWQQRSKKLEVQGREVVRWGERQAYGCICVEQSSQSEPGMTVQWPMSEQNCFVCYTGTEGPEDCQIIISWFNFLSEQ